MINSAHEHGLEQVMADFCAIISHKLLQLGLDMILCIVNHLLLCLSVIQHTMEIAHTQCTGNRQ